MLLHKTDSAAFSPLHAKKRRNIAVIFFSLFEQTHVVATFCFTHKRECTMRMGGKHPVREVLAT